MGLSMKMGRMWGWQGEQPMTTIRFVGGPWHNRLEEVARMAPTIILNSGGSRRANYVLASYETCYGTRYFQYVHESLIDGNYAKESTWKEASPKWTLSKRELDSKIRRIMRRKK